MCVKTLYTDFLYSHLNWGISVSIVSSHWFEGAGSRRYRLYLLLPSTN